LHQRRERTDVRTARPDVAPKLARIIERAIEPMPERRYQSVDVLLSDLTALKPRSRAARLPYELAAAAALLLVMAVGWEVAGRQVAWSSTPTTQLAGIADGNLLDAASVDPTAQPIIAVLPFEDLSPERDSDDLADGLADEIIRSLASVHGLQVRARTSSFVFKDKPRNLREVGELLGANLVVEGAVLRSGSRLRVNARLVQVAGDVALWDERFDREFDDMLAIQDEIEGERTRG
jgi:TolB-like protein